MHRVARKNYAHCSADQDRRKTIKKKGVKQNGDPLPVLRVCRFVSGDHCFEFVTNRKQLVLGHDVFACCFHVIFVDARFDDRIDRTGFFTETTINTFKKVDVVTRRTARTVFADI